MAHVSRTIVRVARSECVAPLVAVVALADDGVARGDEPFVLGFQLGVRHLAQRAERGLFATCAVTPHYFRIARLWRRYRIASSAK